MRQKEILWYVTRVEIGEWSGLDGGETELDTGIRKLVGTKVLHKTH